MSLPSKSIDLDFASVMILKIIPVMLGKLIVIVCCSVILAQPAFSEESLVSKGIHVLIPSLSVSRAVGPNDGWVPGFNFSYGYFLNDWIQPEGGFQFDRGITDDPFWAGSFLGGVSFFYNRGFWALPFGGFRIGLGGLRESDSDGGTQTRMTITVAPKVGVLFRVSKRIGIYTQVEYQRVFILGDERYGYDDLNLIRIPLGVSFSL